MQSGRLGLYCWVISILLFVLVPVQQPTLLLLPASVDLILRLYVVLFFVVVFVVVFFIIFIEKSKKMIALGN